MLSAWRYFFCNQEVLPSVSLQVPTLIWSCLLEKLQHHAPSSIAQQLFVRYLLHMSRVSSLLGFLSSQVFCSFWVSSYKFQISHLGMQNEEQYLQTCPMHQPCTVYHWREYEALIRYPSLLQWKWQFHGICFAYLGRCFFTEDKKPFLAGCLWLHNGADLPQNCLYSWVRIGDFRFLWIWWYL